MNAVASRNVELISHSDQGGRGDGVQIMVHRGYAYIGHGPAIYGRRPRLRHRASRGAARDRLHGDRGGGGRIASGMSADATPASRSTTPSLPIRCWR